MFTSKKFVITLTGLCIIGAAAMMPWIDLSRLQWFAGMVTTMVGVFCASQSASDVGTNGATSGTVQAASASKEV